MSGIGSRTAPTYNAAAPSNYVAGIGRGAMGFTTRSDIGPARPAATAPGAPADAIYGQPPPGYVAGRGRGMGELARAQAGGAGQGAGEFGAAQAAQTDNDRMDYSESNYDEFAGYGERLFSSTTYEADDAEADTIYNSVDDMMDARRKRARERQLLQEQKQAKSARPRIADQFADLKRDLASVSAEQWDSIPEVGDHSLKLKQSRKKESYMPIPDSILLMQSAAMNGANTNSVDPSEGLRSELRNSALSSKLDRISDSVSGQTVVDPKGYLTSLNSVKITSEAEIGDIKKARVLLGSVTSTNPSHGPGWIAAARVEEYANKLANARKIILEGCEKAAHSEDVWLEAARLHSAATAKVILSNALRALPHSVKLYLELAGSEEQLGKKKAVLRRGLEAIPNSVTLWKAAIELESVNDAKLLLSRAIECVPTNVDMYLALAKLETHANARKVLNLAREHIPTERKVWIYAATLEEVNGNDGLVDKIIEKMMFSMAQYEVPVKREDWLAEAIACELKQAPLCCHALLKHTLHLQLDREDWKKVWLDDMQTCLYNMQQLLPADLIPPTTSAAAIPAALHTARGIAHIALQHFPTKKGVWLQVIAMEQEFGTADTYLHRLRESVQAVPSAEILWLMLAKEVWKQQDNQKAREVLMQAYQHNPQSEQIYLAAIKLEWESGELARSRRLLAKALEVVGSARVFLKFALFEQEQGETSKALELLEQGIQRYPQHDKFYLMAGQLQLGLDKGQEARLIFQRGLKHCATSSTALWKALLLLEERDKGVAKARSIGEMPRLKLPKSDLIYLHCLRLERRHQSLKLYTNLLAKALADCPTSGMLHAEQLLHVPKSQYKARSLEALKRLPHDEHVLLAVGRLFERSFNLSKAVKYYERALAANARLGDAYIYYCACLYVHTHRQALQTAHSNKDAPLEQANGIPMAAERDMHYEEVLRGDGEEVQRDMEGVDEDGDEEEEEGKKQVETPVEALVLRCEQAEPNAGELWCELTKTTHMRRCSVRAKLRACLEHVLGFQLLPDTF